MTRTLLKTLNYLSKIESRHWASLNCMITHWSLLLYNKQNKILINYTEIRIETDRICCNILFYRWL